MQICWIILAVTVTAVSSASVSVSVRVGDSVTLPCDGSACRGTPVEKIYIKWETITHPVYEFVYGKSYPSSGFENRTEVPLERIRQGDFSLNLQHTLFTDGEIYKCFCEGDGNRDILLGNVSLTVTAHRDALTLPSGASLSLPLYSPGPVEVLFAAAGEGASVSVCTVEWGAASRPGPGYEQRVSVQSGSLTLRSLTAADQGQYTVRDSSTGRTVSTVSVSVTGEKSVFLVVLITVITVLILVLGLSLLCWHRRYHHCPMCPMCSWQP
ncbi:uncharacterized protein LOC136711094 isoform X2 [Amia ocellicauda]|uniref:uncharacterized protein LOC136711094 isoform X2 n=1 Tax=Amia ocellicauda TaxID=2972642 RepID=UPI00346450D3